MADTDLPIFRLDYFLDTNRYKGTPDARNTLLHEIGCSDNSILFGWSVSPLSGLERKGADRYWEFMREASHEFGDKIRLVIFGPNPSDGGWQWSMIPEDVRNRVSIIPFQDEQRLVELYSGLDYYLCLSRKEGGPYPVIECMSCGVPVISTRVGVVPDVVRDGWNGFIVDSDNYIERILYIIRLFGSNSNTLSEIGKQARATVCARFRLGEQEMQEYMTIVQAATQHWKQRSLIEILKRRTWATIAALTTVITHSRYYVRRYVLGR